MLSFELSAQSYVLFTVIRLILSNSPSYLFIYENSVFQLALEVNSLTRSLITSRG